MRHLMYMLAVELRQVCNEQWPNQFQFYGDFSGQSNILLNIAYISIALSFQNFQKG